jgi:hypothetical protein
LSIKEAVALKRAEARKAISTSASRVGLGNSTGFGDFENLEDADPVAVKKNEEEAPELGRWSVKETIERARSTGHYCRCHQFVLSLSTMHSFCLV